MDSTTWTAVDEYVTALVVHPDGALDDALSATARAGLPPISVTPPQGKLLEILARMVGARRILEIGTLGGYSTIWMARALPAGGRLLSLEIDPRHAEIARENLRAAGVGSVAEVRVGAALDTLAQLAGEGADPFDLVFIDADRTNLPAYFDWSLRLTRPGGVIVVDNVVRHGAIVDEATTEPDVVAIRRFNEMVAGESRVLATTIQTVGSKGYDGFTLALVQASS